MVRLPFGIYCNPTSFTARTRCDGLPPKYIWLLTFIFFRGVGQPPTSHIFLDLPIKDGDFLQLCKRLPEANIGYINISLVNFPMKNGGSIHSFL